MIKVLIAGGIAALVLLPAMAVSAQVPSQLLGPSPYRSQADSPFKSSIESSLGAGFSLEDFEDGQFNTPGVRASVGDPTGPFGFTDSVDEDDGTIDGSGTQGRSFFTGNGSVGITFTFDAQTLGTLPTMAGLVWTDGAGTTTFEAFDAGGASLGKIGPVAIADASNSGETPEDRFFGVTHPGGISAIKISNNAGGIEVDHLQFDRGTIPTQTPSSTSTRTSTPSITPSSTATSTPTPSPSSTSTLIPGPTPPASLRFVYLPLVARASTAGW